MTEEKIDPLLINGPWPDPELPSCDAKGRLVAPWEKYPNLRRKSMGWRMGQGESFKLDWWNFWDSLSEQQKLEYVLDHPENEEWQGYYASLS